MGCALNGKGPLSAPVAVHAALDHRGAQAFRNFFCAVCAEVIDDQHFVTEQYGPDAVFDIPFFIFRQNQRRNFSHNYLSTYVLHQTGCSANVYHRQRALREIYS